MKEKLLKIGSYVLVAALATLVTLTTMSPMQLPKSKLDQLEALIDNCFIGDADPVALENAAAAAMVNATGDRWSFYVPASQYGIYEEQMSNSFVGVGMTILRSDENDGYLITAVNSGGPAEKAGVMVGDLLIQVDGESVVELTVQEVRDRVRGEEGTFVPMVFLRHGDAVQMSVERRKIESPVADYEMLPGKVGLVRIYNFDSRCAQDTISAIESLLSNGAQKLIFDVRFNPGGYAHEMVKVLDYLLPEGELFRSQTYDGKESVDMSDAKCLEMPMAVLVNSSSYSAAEFFAAVLQEYEAATVVGENTVGKGYFQNSFRFEDGSAVSLSVGKYFTPKGVSLAEVGVTPDIRSIVDAETAASIRNGLTPPEKDPQIQAAVRALENQR